MNLNSACSNILRQLEDLVNQINPEDFCKPSHALSQSTIGQHLRHTLEFFICFEQGFTSGRINYDKRCHDKTMETNKSIALQSIQRIANFVMSMDPFRKLTLEVSYDLSSDEIESLDTTAKRELVYNIEHAVHHMAIMKIGMREVAPYVSLSADFGVATSTIRYHEMAGAS